MPAKPPATSAQRSGDTCSPEHGGGQQRHRQRRDEHDRGELGQRHVAQAEEGERLETSSSGAAQQLVAGMAGAQQRRAVRGSSTSEVATAWKR